MDFDLWTPYYVNMIFGNRPSHEIRTMALIIVHIFFDILLLLNIMRCVYIYVLIFTKCSNGIIIIYNGKTRNHIS